MSERQREIMRTLLSYAISNYEDINEVFFENVEFGLITVNGDIISSLNEDELEEFLMELQ